MTAWHLTTFAIFAAIILYPTGRILQRMGFSPFWSVLALIPLMNVIGLWFVALVPWPHEAHAPGATALKPGYQIRTG